MAIRWTKRDIVFCGIIVAMGVALSSAIGFARDAGSECYRISGELEQIRSQYAELGTDLISAEKRAVELADDLNRAYNGTLELGSVGTELEGSITESIAATMEIGRNISRLADTIDEFERAVRVYQELIRAAEQGDQPP